MTPDLIQIVDCLNPTEVQKILSSFNPNRWEQSTVFTGEGKKCEVVESIRKNTRICLNDDEEAAELMHRRMNDSLLKYREVMLDVSQEFGKYPVPGSWKTNCYREPIQVLKYETAEYYNWHHDQASADVYEKNRTFSVVLYLKNADEGGRTIFPHRAYRPKAGQALIFPSNWCFPHRCEPIAAGTKIAAVTWYHCHYNH